MAKKWFASAAVVVAALLIGAWAFGFFAANKYSDDPQVAEMQKLREEAFRRGERPSDAQQQEFRDRIRELTPEQRREFFTSMGPRFAPMMARRLDEFFDLPREEQLQRIDQDIDRMEAMRADGQGGPPWAGRGQMTQQQRDEMMKRMLDNTTPELRSKFEKRLKMMNDRRVERGLEPVGPGRR